MKRPAWWETRPRWKGNAGITVYFREIVFDGVNVFEVSQSRSFVNIAMFSVGPPQGSITSTSTVALRVVGGDEKGTSCLEVRDYGFIT
jgi:hypothetical protein